MKQSERTVLVITGIIGAAILSYLKGDFAIGWLFIMAVAFIGECTEVIASRMEKILAILESRQ